MDKAELKNVREAYTETIKLDNGLKGIVDAKAHLEGQIKNTYHAMQVCVADKEIETMDVEKINMDKEGIRVASLKAAGITTVAQLRRKSKEEIQQVNGIGEVMAGKILKNADILYHQTIRQAGVSLSVEDKSNNMKNLICDLHRIFSMQQIFVSADTLYRDTHETIASKGRKAGLVNSPIKWVFAGKKKKEEAFLNGKELKDLLNRGYGENARDLIKNYQQISRRGVANPWKELENNVAAYSVLLESIIENGIISEDEAGERRAISAVTGRSGLKEELIERISQYQLDLRFLNANLRRYQIFGTQYILHQEKVLLGDEMGLGKTMQAIASICHLTATGGTHFLVVCPLSVVVNWTREIQSNSKLNCIEVYGEGRDEEMNQWVSQGGVAITTYETLVRVPVPENVHIDFLVVDEAHYIKNPAAQRTQAVQLAMGKAERVLLMSGTPLENRVEEMQFLIGCLREDIADKIKNMKQLSRAEDFREAIAPVYLRRVREDVLKELPELLEKEQWCIMCREEIINYEGALVANNFMKARQVSWIMEDVSKSGKANRLLEICNEAKENQRKILVFSFFKGTLEKVAGLLGDDCIGIIDGSVPSSERQKMIDALSGAPAGGTLVCQIQAGGVGLNIQSASVVIFCEPQMKPSLETQAIARAYRMGQSRSVIVHRLLMQDTVDERILEILSHKEDLFDNFADESVIGISDVATKTDAPPATVSSEQVKESLTASRIMEEECRRRGIERNNSIGG